MLSLPSRLFCVFTILFSAVLVCQADDRFAIDFSRSEPDLTLLSCGQRQPQKVQVHQRYQIPDSSLKDISKQLPGWLSDDLAVLFQPPWLAMLQGSERWQVWSAAGCVKLALGNNNGGCFGLLEVCPGNPPQLQEGELEIPAQPAKMHNLLLLTSEQERFGIHLFPIAGGNDLEVDSVDGPEPEDIPQILITPEFSRALVFGFIAGASTEAVYKVYRHYRDNALAPWAWGMPSTWSVLNSSVQAGIVSSLMLAASYSITQSTGLWKPASVLLVNTSVRSARIVHRYLNSALAYDQIPGEVLWAFIKASAVTGAGHVISTGTHIAHKALATPGAIAGGMVGDAFLEQLRDVFSIPVED